MERVKEKEACDFVFPKEVVETIEKYWATEECTCKQMCELLLATIRFGAYGEKPNMGDFGHPVNILYLCTANWVLDRNGEKSESN